MKPLAVTLMVPRRHSSQLSFCTQPSHPHLVGVNCLIFFPLLRTMLLCMMLLSCCCVCLRLARLRFAGWCA